MTIAIISDLHDNLANWQKFLVWAKAKEINTLLCLGDVTSADTLNKINKGFAGTIYLVEGNADNFQPTDIINFKNIKHLGQLGKIILGDLNIGLIHQPELKTDLLKKYPDTKFDFIFYGHTHKPWLNKEGSTIIANPGTLGSMFPAGTFAILNTQSSKLELLSLNDI